MKIEEFRELVKDKFEEVSYDEWMSTDIPGEFRTTLEDKFFYFKPKEKLPKVFENDTRKITVKETGHIILEDKTFGEDMCLDISLPLLYEAVKLSKKLYKK